MRSRIPLPEKQHAHVGFFLEAAALFAALCVFARSAALVLAAVLAAPFPAAQTLLWVGRQAVAASTQTVPAASVPQEEAPASSAVPEAVPPPGR